nr:hypothetical protein [Psychrobacter sp. PraFG1]UNK04544.1 hypothetical protein MN210_09660 [Psychrobacter sp. PraFG1]
MNRIAQSARDTLLLLDEYGHKQTTQDQLILGREILRDLMSILNLPYAPRAQYIEHTQSYLPLLGEIKTAKASHCYGS